MLPIATNYRVVPAVVSAGTETEIKIIPNERAFLFFDGAEYLLHVICADDDEVNYFTPTTKHTLNLVAEDGILRFSYTFVREQEYLLILERDEKKVAEFFIYSLAEDLYRLTPLRGDFHGHSYRSDGRRDPAALLGHYREQGYDFMALTDHNRYYSGNEMDEAFEGVKLGITHVPGEEVHFPGCMIHTVHVGGKSSVTALYCKDEEGCRTEADSYLDKVPAEVPEAFRERFSRLMWITDHIHEAGGLAIFPHPFWKPGGSRVFNVKEEFARVILKSGLYDAYELVGGMGQIGINFSVNLFSELRAEGLRMPVVGSSDVHGIVGAPTFPHYFTICFAEENSVDSIIDTLKDGRTVAVEAVGDEYARHYRCYGDLRLVYYAQFLLTHYFPKLQRICAGEGIAMVNYLMGISPASLIEAQVAQTLAFKDEFFGRTAPASISDNIFEFENKWREVQLAGPRGKGSAANTEKITRQI
ncbi:MAG: PHP domain-containing protein [Clostridia bacterium]|nr:PHP domain-containing protein [Clostridia bacterium]